MRLVATAIVLVAAATAAAAVAAGENKGTVRRDVAGHRFQVPRAYLFDDVIPWLPAPEKDSFVFLLRPSDDQTRIPRHRFLVEPLTRHCPGNASQMLRIACGSEKTSVGDNPPYVKVQSDRGAWASDLYSVRRAADGSTEQKRQLAYCQRFEPNPVKPAPNTICTTFWAYKGMLVQFSFDEEESGAVPTMKDNAMRLLDSWEAH